MIFCSSHACDLYPETVPHIQGKLNLENYFGCLHAKGRLASGYTILRAASLFENWDSVFNPLTYGKLRDLYPPQAKIPLVSTRDVGKAAVTIARNQELYNGKTIDCVSAQTTGPEAAQILSHVSQTPCSYQVAPPRLVQYWMLNEVYRMVQFTSTSPLLQGDKTATIADFRELVPDAPGVRQWFQRKNQWSDGTLFGKDPPRHHHHHHGDSPQMLAAVGAAVVAFAAWAVSHNFRVLLEGKSGP